jgi:PEP-CTERM motif
MKKILLSIAVITLFAVRANADVLASYPFAGSSRASTDSDVSTTASNITDGAGVISIIDTTRGNPSPSISVSSDQIDGSTNTAAVTANDYISFTLTPGSGITFSLTSFALDAFNYTNDGTFSAESYFLRSSVNGFASNIGTTQSIVAASMGAITPNSFDLTGASFQNLTAPIEFRLFFQDGISDPDRGLAFDNITLNGTAVVPEPATWMLMGVGLLLGAQRLRRKS